MRFTGFWRFTASQLRDNVAPFQGVVSEALRKVRTGPAQVASLSSLSM
jgi:hypothetical protein